MDQLNHQDRNDVREASVHKQMNWAFWCVDVRWMIERNGVLVALYYTICDFDLRFRRYSNPFNKL